MQHGCLLIKRGQIRCTGNIAAYSPVKPIDSQSHAILGNRSSQNGNLVGSGLCCLQSRCGIGQNQVYASGYKTVDNGGAGICITLGVLLVKYDSVPQLFNQGVFKSFRCRIQRVMLYQLADTHVKYLLRLLRRRGLFAFCSLAACRCGCSRLCSRCRGLLPFAGASCHGHNHSAGKNQRQNLR